MKGRGLSLAAVTSRIDNETARKTLDGALFDSHLRCCPRMGDTPCQWCDWAVVTTDTEHLVAAIDDADSLLAASPSSLQWSLAAWSINESVTTLPAVGVRAEVALIMQAMENAFRERQERVRTAIAQAAVTGGELEQCCVRIASIRSVAKMTHPASWWEHYLSSAIRAKSHGLLQRIEVDRLRRICTFEIERMVTGEPIDLQTQPELNSLQRRREGHRRFIFSEIDRGSIEELALEAVLDEITEGILAVAASIADSPGLVPVRLLPSRPAHVKAVRASIWLSCSIDWVQTFIDITGAPCWRTQQDEAVMLTVPWFVAVDLEGNKSAGLMSATEQEHRLANIQTDLQRKD